MTSIENELAGFLRIKDRLESTTNEKLESVLSLLLPRIIPIVNDPEKRDAIMEIIKVAKERIESVNVPLPTLRLLELVSTEFQPKAGILAIEFLDICISNISPDIHMECINIIIHNLAELKPFSEESNALLYYFSRFLPSLTTNSECINILKRAPLPVLIMIGDWLFDATQLQVVTVRDAVGSVVQGLSPERMHRLTVRHQTWTLADIRSLKHDLIKSFSMPWLPSALTMCILLSCLHSNDQEVKSEAIFKVNGARGLFDIHEDVNAAQTISTLLNLCIHRSHLSIIVDNVCVSEDGPDALISTICNNRSDLPNTFKIVILEFLVKEMTGHIRRHANIIFKLVKSSILYVSENTNSINPTITEEQSINNPTAFAFRSLTMKLLNKLTVKLSIEELTTHQKLLIATIKSCLQQFVVKGTRIVGEELSRSAMLRDSCYEIVSHVTVATAVNPSNSDYSLVETLFKMLDLEGTHTSVTLHSALGALRESLVTLQSSETVSYLSTQLRSLLLDTRKSSQRKVQVLTAQWMLSLFSWDQITIETLFLLATQVPSTREVGSSVAEDESVQTLIKREFTTLALSLRKESSTLTTPTTKEIIFSNILRFIGSEQFNHFSFSKGHFYLLHSACIYMIDYMNSIYGSKFNYARASTYDILDQWIMKNRGAGIIIPSMIQVSEQIICASLESLAQLVVKVNDISVSERSRMIITTVQYIRNILMIYQSENIQSIVRTKLSSILQAWITDDNSNKYELNSTRYLLLQQDISLCLAIASSSANYTFISLQIRALSLAIPKSLFESNKPINISSLSGSWCGSFLSLCYMYRVIVDRVNNDSSLLSSTQLLSGNLVVSMHNIVTGSDLSGLTVETSLALSTLLLGYRQILSTSTSKVLSTEHLQLHKETINMLSTSLNKVTRPVAATAIFDFLATEIDPENNTDTDTVQSQLSLYVLSSKWWASRNTFWTTEVSTSELFAFAELAFRYLHTSSSFMLDIETKLKSISYAQEKVSAREKTSASIFLLVLIRTQLQSCLSLADILALQSKLFEWIDRLLHNLLFKDLLVQDICVLSLGYIYQHITSLSTNSATVIEDAKVLQDIANRIAHEVIVILCKDKRLNQPVGMAVAGENTEATVAPVDAMTDILAGDADDTGFLNNDPLVRAASALVSELGVQLVQRTENIGTGATGNAPQNRAAATNISSTQNYGIFTSIAKLAKKAGCEYLVFSLLPLLRKNMLLDNLDVNESVVFIYGVTNDWHENELYKILRTYEAPQPVIEEAELVQLFPKLLMARFEPVLEIREAIRKLYDDLLPSDKNKQYLKTYENSVLEYLLQNLEVKKWQDRASAALALEYTLPSISWVCLQRHLGVLWDRGFTLLDDIYDGCRSAAMRFMKLLGEEVLAHCEYPNASISSDSGSSNSSNINDRRLTNTIEEANATVTFLLDRLLTTGILSTCLEAKGFSFGLLINLVKSARGNLCTHQPRLISVMVECMSAFEPQLLQYLQFHTGRMNITDESLERKRLDISQQSPMQEALNTLLETLDKNNLQEVLIELRNQTVSGVGLATRVSAVQSLARLAEVYPDDVGSNCGIVCQSVAYMLLNSASNTSVTLLKAMFSGLGSLARVMPSEAVIDTVRLFLNQYQNLDRVSSSSWSDVSFAVASCLSQILTRAGDKVTSDQSTVEQLLVISFIGRYETLTTEQQNKSTWESIWNEMLQVSTYGTQQIATEKILPPLLKFVSKMLRNNAWNIRTQGLAVLKDILRVLDKSMFTAHSAAISQCVDSMYLLITPGNIWTGQSEVLETLALIVSKCSDLVDYTCIADDLSSTGTEGVIKENDSIPLELARNSLMSVDITEKVNYSVSVHKIIQLLLREAMRGDNEYKLSASKALASLPWAILSTRNHDLFVQCLPALCSLVGATEECIHVERFKSLLRRQFVQINSEDKESDSIDITSVISITNSLPSTARPATNRSPGPTVIAKKVNTASVFGSRYGSTAAVITSKTNVKRARIAASRAIASDSVTLPDQQVESSDSTVISDSALLSVDNDNNSSSVTVVAMHTVEEKPTESITISNEIIPMSIKLNEPAFRMKIVECLAQGWPTLTATMSSNQSQILLPHRNHLLIWSIYALQNEVWSLKKATLELLPKLLIETDEDLQQWWKYSVSKVGSFDEDDIKKLEQWNRDLESVEYAIIMILITCSFDSKHSPLRSQVFICLSQLCRNTLQIGPTSRMSHFFVTYRKCIDTLLQTNITDAEENPRMINRILQVYSSFRVDYVEASSYVLSNFALAKTAWSELQLILNANVAN